MDMDIATLPKKGLKTRQYSIDMEKRDLKTSLYSMDMSKKDLKTSPYSMDMEKKDLKKLTKGQLIKLLMNQRKKPTPPPRTGKWESVKPKPVPRKRVNEDTILPPSEQFRNTYKPIPPPRTGKWKSVKPKSVLCKCVKQMVKEYEDIIRPPEQFRDGYKPIPKPRTDRPLPPKREPSSKIKELNQALKGNAKSYGIELQDSSNPLNHFAKTKALVKSHLEDLLKDMKGFKFIETLEVTFQRILLIQKLGSV